MVPNTVNHETTDRKIVSLNQNTDEIKTEKIGNAFELQLKMGRSSR